MDYIALFDWSNETDIHRFLNERIYEITEDPCVTPYQCWLILNCVKEVMIKRAYTSSIKFIAGKIEDAKVDISRAEGYRFLYGLYYEDIMGQSSPDMDMEDIRGYSGKLKISVFMGEDKEVLDSIEDFVSYMIFTDNWFKPERFLIEWKEHGMKSPGLFDSADTERW